MNASRPSSVITLHQSDHLGLSQEELADRVRLHWTDLSDLERGRQTPTLDVINRLARALGVTLAEFFAPFDESFRVRSRKPRSDTT